MEINEHWVQFQGKFLLPEPLDRERYTLLSGEFEHGDLVEKNNQDGTVDLIYKVSPLRIMVGVGDKKLIGKVKRRGSQRLRGAVWHEFQKTDLPEDQFDDYYDSFINKLIVNLEEVNNYLGTQKG